MGNAYSDPTLALTMVLGVDRLSQHQHRSGSPGSHAPRHYPALYREETLAPLGLDTEQWRRQHSNVVNTTGHWRVSLQCTQDEDPRLQSEKGSDYMSAILV